MLMKGGIISSSDEELDNWQPYTGTDGLLPCDVLKREGQHGLPNFSGLDGQIITNATSSDIVKSYIEDTYAIFVGVLPRDVALKSGIILRQGWTLTVTVSNINEEGSIRLCFEDAPSWFDIASKEYAMDITTDSTDLNGNPYVVKEKLPFFRNYYWIKNPDSFCYVKPYR